MSAPFEGDPASAPPERWDTAKIDFDDPAAPRNAKYREFARVLKRTGFYDVFGTHPEYQDVSFEVFDAWNEMHYHGVIQDCNVIVSQLKDNMKTKISDEQRRLLTPVLRLPPHASKLRIVAAYDARTRYMQLMNLAVACKTSLRDLPQALADISSPFSEPLTEDDILDIVSTYEAMIDDANAADDEDKNYHDFDWDDDTDAVSAAIRVAEEQLGLRMPRRAYSSPVSFDIEELRWFSIEQLSDRDDEELNRMLDLIVYIPPDIPEIELILARSQGRDLDTDKAIDIQEAMELYLEKCIYTLDDTGWLRPPERRFVQKVLGLPRNTPSLKILEVFEQRMKYMGEIHTRIKNDIKQPRSSKADASASASDESSQISESDTASAIEAVEIILHARQIALDILFADHTEDAIREAALIFADTPRVTRLDMPRAVFAAVDHIRRRVGPDDEDDNNRYAQVS